MGKNLSSCAFILLFFATFLHGQNSNWKWISPLPQGNNLNSVCMLNENTIYAAGDNGTILKTDDYGQTWRIQNSGTTENLDFIFVFESGTGYVYTKNGIKLKTENGGETWVEFSSDLSETIYKIIFINENVGYAITNDNLFKTENGGAEWFPLFDSDYFWITAISFIDENRGWIAGEEGRIFKTTDGGTGWIDLPVANEEDYYSDICFVNENVGFAIDYGLIIRTSNGGINWERREFSSYFELRQIVMTNETNGFIIGDNFHTTTGVSFYTTDGGDNWLTHNAGYENEFNCVAAVSLNKAALVGKSGLILTASNDGSEWLESSQRLPSFLSSQFFLAPGYGFFCGDDGLIIKTADGGNSLTFLNSGTSRDLTSIFFVDENTGYCCGGNHALLKTADGGNSWTEKEEGLECAFYDVVFPEDENLGYACGTCGVYKTTDGGEFWTKQLEYQYGDFRELAFTDNEFGLALNSYKLYITANGGIQWNEITVGDAWSFTACAAPNRENIFVLAGGEVYKSTDYGETWTKKFQTDSFCAELQFIDQNNGFLSGKTLFKTTDGGETWNEAPTGINFLGKTFFFNDKTGYAISDLSILKTENGGGNVTEVATEENSEPEQFHLYQNYPNPFSKGENGNPSTVIKYKIENEGFVTLKIYDILGKEIAVPVNSFQKAGSYSVSFNAKNLPGGIYFYRLQTGRFSETRKMILVK